MRTVAFIAALVGSTFAAPQAVTSAVSPSGQTPAGCQTSYNGQFQVVVQSIQKRSLEIRDSTPLELTLNNGVLKDSKGRTGYIASNQQFQFDGPVQAGALYTSGWSVCSNGSIALGNSAVFYQCLSGTFYNLYDANTAAQCSPVYLNALGQATTTSAGAPVGNAASAGAHTVVCQIGDGQIQQDTCITTATPPPTTSSAKPTGVTVTQIGDGQIQAAASATPTAATAAATTAKAATTSAAVTGAVVSQIGDGQAQAGNSSVIVASRTPSTTAAASTSTAVVKASTGAAAVARTELGALVAAIAAFAFLL